jgi:hypothetical protein
MQQNELADKFELTELANKLFMYCDAQQWKRMLDEVFTPTIWFDVTSTGAPEALMMEAQDVCKAWEKGFIGLDGVHHQAGHYLVTLEKDSALIYGYAVATHHKKAALKGQTRSFTGSYELKATRTPAGWRLNQFKYLLKFMDGNLTLE